jgi:hypothetical protein
MREGTYGGENGTDVVYFEDAQTRQDLADCYAVVPEFAATGSPNLENSQLRGMLEQVERGHQLAPAQLDLLRDLVAKYRPQIEALRASPDRQGQDLMAKPDAANARFVDRPESDGEGLLDLGSAVPMKSVAA